MFFFGWFQAETTRKALAREVRSLQNDTHEQID